MNNELVLTAGKCIEGVSAVDIATVVIALLALSLSLLQFVRDNSREKREATLNAYNDLQTHVFTELNCFLKPYRGKEEDLYKLEINDDSWEHLTEWLARIERFSVGVNTHIYSLSVLNRLGGGYYIRLFETLKPIIDKKRFKNTSKGKHYDEFELTVKRLLRLRKLLRCIE